MFILAVYLELTKLLKFFIMTNETVQFTGKSLRSKEDLKRMIKDAEWQVEYYNKEVQKAQDTLYARQIALESLKNELNVVTDVENSVVSINF